jgi:hypothetical protein
LLRIGGAADASHTLRMSSAETYGANWVRSRTEIIMSYAFKVIPSPVGKLKLIASDKGLVAILWENDNPKRVKVGALVENQDHPIILETERQLQEYFEGRRKVFNLKLDLKGTKFQNDVWQALLGYSFRRNKKLWTPGAATRQSTSDAGRRSGERKKSDFHRSSLSSRDRIVWKIDGVRRRPGD